MLLKKIYALLCAGKTLVVATKMKLRTKIKLVIFDYTNSR